MPARAFARREVRKLPCSDHLKEIIYRCIGERRKRYESADELIDALSNPPALLKSGALRTLKGVHLAFTGIFSKLRRDVEKAAKRAGANVHGMPSIKTTVVVRGKPNALQAAGRDAGRKLMEIKRLREKGHRIVIISEPQFWRLAAQIASRDAEPFVDARRLRSVNMSNIDMSKPKADAALRHAGPADPEDARHHGRAARLQHRPPHRADVRHA